MWAGAEEASYGQAAARWVEAVVVWREPPVPSQLLQGQLEAGLPWRQRQQQQRSRVLRREVESIVADPCTLGPPCRR